MPKILIFGTGSFAEYWKPRILSAVELGGISLLGFIDNDTQKQRQLHWGKEVYSPENAKAVDFDKILIFVATEKYTSVYRQLTHDLNIPPAKVSSPYYLLYHLMNLQRKSFQFNIDDYTPSRIFDCFTFFNELDLLKIRLETLYDIVDHFVIVELNQSHRGRNKPYYFAQNKDIFSCFADKIIYLQPKDIPAYKGIGDWTIENYQRNCLSRGLSTCRAEDICIISDLDEIPNPKILQQLRRTNGACRSQLQSNILTNFLEENAVAFEQYFHFYNFNIRHKVNCHGSVMVKYKNMITPQLLRDYRDIMPDIFDGGWHLSYFGSAESIANKAESIVDGEDVTAEMISARMEKGIDIYGRTGRINELELISKNEIIAEGLGELMKRYPQFCKK